MYRHIRKYCNDCKRQYISPTMLFNSRPESITGNPARSDICQVCGSSNLIEVIYFHPIPGMDYEAISIRS